MRGVTLTNQSGEIHTLVISTHTPHARRDCFALGERLVVQGISTHTPHARRDSLHRRRRCRQRQFLLTRLMRGVTVLNHQLLELP